MPKELEDSAKLVVLRLVMLSFGRFFPDLIRRLLQRILITGKKRAPFDFSRSFEWTAGGWKVTDELRAKSWQDVLSAAVGCDQTSIYVVMSRTFQMGQLQEWLDLTDEIKNLARGQSLKLERRI